MPAVTHVVSLQQAAGVEAHFAAFIDAAARRHAEWVQSWLNPARTVHPYFSEELRRCLAWTARMKYRGPLKLPARPAWIRKLHCRRILAKARPDVIVIWNRTEKLAPILDGFDPERFVHWEHGSAWFGGREQERRRYLSSVRTAITNSHASARVLQQLWDYRGEIHVCRNALRPSMLPERVVERSHPSGAPVRLGVAARLSPVKGIPLVLHAVRRLLDRSLPVELHVAGAGPDRGQLAELARSLDIAEAVRFHGSVRDMRSFYGAIDCLVHLPLTEAFGLVAIEAAAWGVPVVAAAVDGLPEAVTDGVTGYTLAPDRPLAEYPKFGGRLEGIPEVVYDPLTDGLIEPRFVDPDKVAEVVSRLFADSARYEEMSRSASSHVLDEYGFDAHVDDVMRVVENVSRRR